MLGLYIVCAIVAGGLMFVTALGSAHHADVDGAHDVGGIDTHTPAPGETQGEFANDSIFGAINVWFPIFGLRFWVYCIGTFGMLGTLLTLTKLTNEYNIAIIAGVTGIVTGYMVATLARLANKVLPGDSIGEHDFEGTSGRLLVAIAPGQLGKVRVTVKGDIIDLIAKSIDDTPIPKDEEVVILTIENNIALVQRLAAIMEDAGLDPLTLNQKQ